MRIADLGSLTVWRGAPGSEVAVDLGGPKPRALLGILALQGGRPTSAERLVEMVWPDRPVAAALPSLQTYVAKLRQVLEPGRAARSPATVLTTSPAGYALQVERDAIDSRRFTVVVQAVHGRLNRATSGIPALPPAMSAGEATELRTQLTEVLELWRDTPFRDLPDEDGVLAERARLEGLHLLAIEDLALLQMAGGADAAVADTLQPLLTDHPVRESLWALAVLALARAGRQSDALDTARSIRTALADDLGIDPGPVLQQVENAVLRQDPHLHWRVPGAPPAGPPESPAVAPTRSPGPDAAGGVLVERGTRPQTAGAPSATLPLVGRADELAALLGLVDRARTGRPGSALIVGEAGIGKSRLIAEVTARARTDGVTVVSATCSADTGAPPLWPWSRLLEQLDDALPSADGKPFALLTADSRTEDEGTRFRWWEAVLARLESAAGRSPLLLVVDDIHWADASTLSLLAHVIDRVTEGRLAVLLGRRPVVEPPEALAALGEALARHDAVRIDLPGLRAPDIAELLAAADGTAVPDRSRTAAEMYDRTSGNAFFVTELIRLTMGGGGSHEIPRSVSDVVLSRLTRLPAESRDVLSVAAVAGRTFDALLLSASTDRQPEEVLEALTPAVAGGLIVEIDAARYGFAHALVRDAVESGLPGARRSRCHADVARALEHGRTLDPGTARSEAARHWLSAGPLYVGPAWRAAAAAAADAIALRAWVEAAALLRDAITAALADSTATPAQRYELQMQLAEVCRWQADQRGLDEALLAAVATANGMDDWERAARAAIGTIEAAVWLPREFGAVEPRVVSALRHSLRRLPSRETEVGCRVMLALASELYYADAPQERAALVEQGLALARRIDEPDLLVWAMTAAFQATWRPGTRIERLGLAREALAAAERSGDPRHEAIARYLMAASAGENGLIDLMWEQVHRGRAVCEANGLTSPLVALGWLAAPWLALQGRVADAWALVASSTEVMERTSMPHKDVAPGATALILQVITDDIRPEIIEAFRVAAGGSRLPMQTTLLWMLVRSGRLAEARERFASHGAELPLDTWLATAVHAQLAEICAGLPDPDLGAQVYRVLEPLAGTPAATGASSALGPVDTYLALAAVATGERAVAARHADDARRLCEQWAIPLAAQRLADLRSRYGF